MPAKFSSIVRQGLRVWRPRLIVWQQECRITPWPQLRFFPAMFSASPFSTKSMPPETGSGAVVPKQNLGKRAEQLLALVVQRFNELSGYGQIEHLKQRISECNANVIALRQSLEQARKQLADIQRDQTASQREVNEMLLRKHEWTAADVQRFTDLYRRDHSLAHDVEAATIAARTKEEQLEDARTELQQATGERYREEQIWSDKIRQASTWGTLVLTAINIIFFLLVQLLLEPWKRRRIVRAISKQFEDRLEASQEEQLRHLAEQLPESESEPESKTPSLTSLYSSCLEMARQVRWQDGWSYYWQSLQPLAESLKLAFAETLAASANALQSSVAKIDLDSVILLSAGTLLGAFVARSS